MIWTKRFFFFFLFTFSLLFQPPLIFAATTFDLIAPSGQLTRGQEIQFTINIDTKGSIMKSTQIGAQYQTQFLQYLSTVPGEAVSQLSAQDLGSGKILLTASNTTGFTGKGVFAYLNFKIIAQAPGSTELCTLFVPSTPTPIAPTNPSVPTPTTILPTRLPQSGEVKGVESTSLMAILFLAMAAGLLIVVQKVPFDSRKKNK